MLGIKPKNIGSKLISKNTFALFALFVLFLTPHLQAQKWPPIISKNQENKVINGYEVEPVSIAPTYDGTSNASAYKGPLFDFPDWDVEDFKWELGSQILQRVRKSEQQSDLNQSEIQLQFKLQNMGFYYDNPGIYFDVEAMQSYGSYYDDEDMNTYLRTILAVQITYLQKFLKLNLKPTLARWTPESSNLPEQNQAKIESGIHLKLYDGAIAGVESEYQRTFIKRYSDPHTIVFANWLYWQLQFTTLQQNLKIGPYFHHLQSFVSSQTINDNAHSQAIKAYYDLAFWDTVYISTGTSYVYDSHSKNQYNSDYALIVPAYDQQGQQPYVYLNEDALLLHLQLKIKIKDLLDIQGNLEQYTLNATKKRSSSRQENTHYGLGFSLSL